MDASEFWEQDRYLKKKTNNNKKLQIRHQNPRMRMTQKFQEDLWEIQALQTQTARPEV